MQEPEYRRKDLRSDAIFTKTTKHDVREQLNKDCLALGQNTCTSVDRNATLGG
jgi:hypothetical protein